MLVVAALADLPATTPTGRNDAVREAAAAGLNDEKPNDQHRGEQLSLQELMHEVELSRAAQSKLAAQLAEHVALVANLQGQIDALRPPALPPKTRTVSVAMTAMSQQERRLSESESASCCRWTNSGSCGSNVTKKCTQLHEYLESKVSTHVFEDADSCLGSTQADWGFAFHGEDAEVALSTAGSEVARVKTPIKVTHASDCSATAELQMDTTVAGALIVAGTLTSDGADIGAAVATLQQQMAAVKSAGVVDPFTTIDTTAAGVNANWKYYGAAAVGTTVFFAPRIEDNVGVLDTTTSTFSTIGTTAAGVFADEKYSGAAAVGTTVFFTPFLEDNVGVLDTTTSTFSTIDTTAAGVNADYKYHGAAAVGTTVIFAPVVEDNVGVLDTTTSTFSTIDTTAAGVNAGWKYSGAAAVGTTVFFTPHNEDNVGVLDTTTSTFSTIDTTAAGVNADGKYTGAAAVGTTVIFAPYNEDNVGVLDTTTSTFSTIGTTAAGVNADYKYYGAAAVGTTVFFAPYNEDNVGVLDTTTSTFSTIGTTAAGVNANGKYFGAAAVGTTVFFTPFNEDNVGVVLTPMV